MGGKIYDYRLQWKKLSTDKWIYSVVRDSILAFDRLPLQRTPSRPLTFSEADTFILDSAVLEFFKHKIVERCVLTGGQGFFSNIFSVVKSDGTVRVIQLKGSK